MFVYAHHTVGRGWCAWWEPRACLLWPEAYLFLVVGRAWFACVLVCVVGCERLCGEFVKRGVVNTTARVSRKGSEKAEVPLAKTKITSN